MSNYSFIGKRLDELRPLSPTTGNFTIPPPIPRHVERARAQTNGHRRTHSSPGAVTLDMERDVRARSMSGGRIMQRRSRERAVSEVISKSVTAPTSPANPPIESPVIPPVMLLSPMPEVHHSRGTPSPVPLHVEPPSPPAIRPVLLTLPSPPVLSPTAIGGQITPNELSPPLVTPPTVEIPHPPSRPFSLAPPITSSGAVKPTNDSLHAVAVASASPNRNANSYSDEKDVAMEKADSFSKTEKGKARGVGERPAEGRQQTPRRGLVGAGGIMHKLQTSQTLPIASKPIRNASPGPRSSTQHAQRSATFLRPPPPTPLAPSSSEIRFAPSTSRIPSPSPSPSRQHIRSPTFAPMSGMNMLSQPDVELIEIPRFKKRQLNLGIVRRQGRGQRIAWVGLWGGWLLNGLLSLFFDVNVVVILVQCTKYPSFDTNSGKSWQFATGAYCVLWILSTVVVWLGWEAGYEFWRRWRLPREARPAIEPIYLSLPASLHLSLYSYDHFTYLLHIRTSPLSTPYARDIIPETCHAVLQLIPGLLPLIPRAAIAVVVLIAFWQPEADVQAPYGGAVDETAHRDTNFFRSDAPGELTSYAKGVLLTFTVWVAARLVLVIAAGLGLWVFSGRPLGGLIGHREKRRPPVEPPTTPRKPKSSIQPRDPSQTSSPQKNSIDNENQFQWAWKERTRSRIQDAFELCMIRRNDRRGGFSSEAGTTMGQVMEMRSGQTASIPMTTPVNGQKQDLQPHSGVEAIDMPVEEKDPLDGASVENSTKKTTPEAARPESGLHPSDGMHLRPSTSRANTNASSSAPDIFYTPLRGNTPMNEKPATAVHTLADPPAKIAELPPSAFKQPISLVTEFGVKEGRGSEDSGSGEGDDESTGLLSSTATPSSASRDRSASTSSSRRRPSITASQNYGTSGSGGSGSTGTGGSRSSSSRRRAYTTTSQRALDASRGRSSSITLLRESVTNAAVAAVTAGGNVGGGLIRRARSGTVLSNDSSGSGYSKFGAKNMQDSEEEEEELLVQSAAIPRSARRQSGSVLGLPFALPDQ
ncbi:hypothetical protein CI109_106995 [Kwoniella shandongensis]|uniref:Uncharacterized protein n=1 Tax=Kwoniella shandongensis TaxID=1734106 RepID=A0A5M6CAW3_9TREE|nr:uncharacterized protein CI109_000753 [Kwoniella shandongensis]KAA5530575.1 hypothetical protein CI109_000753 [Kwoniella shandongensis]